MAEVFHLKNMPLTRQKFKNRATTQAASYWILGFFLERKMVWLVNQHDTHVVELADLFFYWCFILKIGRYLKTGDGTCRPSRGKKKKANSPGYANPEIKCTTSRTDVLRKALKPEQVENNEGETIKKISHSLSEKVDEGKVVNVILI